MKKKLFMNTLTDVLHKRKQMAKSRQSKRYGFGAIKNKIIVFNFVGANIQFCSIGIGCEETDVANEKKH